MLWRHEIRVIALFLLAFGLHQAGIFVLGINSFFGWLLSLIYVVVTLIAILFIKGQRSRFSQHGFLLPGGVGRYLAVAVFFGFVYVFIIIFLPGAISGFDALPGALLSLDTFLTGGSIVLASIASETVFRGYVQTEVEADHGFYIALILVSSMFALYMLPVTTYFAGDLTGILRGLLPLLAESVFLCAFFKESKTLLCPIAFTATVEMLKVFTPLEALTGDYTLPFMIVTYIVLIPVMQSFVGDVRQQDERLDSTPVPDSEEDDAT
jgi:membrane protease YdiL (CAAX protease family)